MSYIASIFARQILDSRGNPTVEVDVLTENNESKKIEITTGSYNYDYIEIKSGLAEGDEIIISHGRFNIILAKGEINLFKVFCISTQQHHFLPT